MELDMISINMSKLYHTELTHMTHSCDSWQIISVGYHELFKRSCYETTLVWNPTYGTRWLIISDSYYCILTSTISFRVLTYVFSVSIISWSTFDLIFGLFLLNSALWLFVCYRNILKLPFWMSLNPFRKMSENVWKCGLKGSKKLFWLVRISLRSGLVN